MTSAPASRARRRRRIGRAVIDHQDVIELLERPLGHLADCFSSIRRNDRRDRRCDRSRPVAAAGPSIVNARPDENPPRDRSCGRADRRRRARSLSRARFHRRASNRSGRDVLDHRQMLRRRAEILAERQHLAADLAQVVHRLEKFRLLFAQPEHDPAFRDHTSARALSPCAAPRARCDISRANAPRASAVRRSPCCD